MVIDDYVELLENAKNLILTGAPGTGKTYLARQIAMRITMQSEIKGRFTDNVQAKDVEEKFKQYMKEIVEKNADEDKKRTTSKGKADDWYPKYFLEMGKNLREIDKKYSDLRDNFFEYNSNAYKNVFKEITGLSDEDIFEIIKGKQLRNTTEFQELNKRFRKQIDIPDLGTLMRKLLKFHFPIQNETNETNEQFEFVQFHPSYDYTDFVEGLRPISSDEDGDEKISFKLEKGIFKKFCEKARKVELIQRGGVDNFDETWNKFITEVQEKDENEQTYDEVKTKMSKVMKLRPTDSGGIHNIVTNKTFNRTQCYNVYRGLPGVPKRGYDHYRKAIIEHLKEKFGLKVYSKSTKLENESLDEKNMSLKKYVFVIDEINRGEVSKIFGELFFSIDPGYRGKKGAVKTQYSNMHDDENEKFYIPENVYIIGTMNDIDRSVESFDFAMRRRFTWEEITAEQSAINMKLPDEIKKKMANLNNEISSDEIGLNSSYHIGGAYFLKLEKYDGDYNKLWKYHLEPLLKEYLRGMPDLEVKLKNLKDAYDK